MNTKYIYHNKELRCKIKYIKYLNHYHLQLQKKILFFWLNVYKWMTVKEGFWGECERSPILINEYQYGNIDECYMTGTLDLKKRVEQFFKEYFEYNRIRQKAVSRLEEIV